METGKGKGGTGKGRTPEDRLNEFTEKRKWRSQPSKLVGWEIKNRKWN